MHINHHVFPIPDAFISGFYLSDNECALCGGSILSKKTGKKKSPFLSYVIKVDNLLL